VEVLKRILLAVFALTFANSVEARAPLDCPLRDAPYSTNSPLIDILLNPAAKAVVDSHAPGLFKGLPPQMFGPVAPSFSAIMTLRGVAGFAGKAPESVASLDAPLAAVPVTKADKVARCARYDNDRPKFVMPAGRPHILLFEKMTGFRDGPSVDAAHAALLAMAQKKGWAMVATDKGGAMNPATLAKFDLVIWNNVSGDVLTLTQRDAFRKYLDKGGGFIGIHGSAGDPFTFWDWYVDTLIGARFAGHPMAPQFQDARIIVEPKGGALTSGLPSEWVMKDEWYSFTTNPRKSGSAIIATLDEASYNPVGMRGQQLRMGDHPIAWSRCVGRGRVFYSAIGHRPEVYSDPRHLTLLENAVSWTTEGRKQGCSTNPYP
jgi:type 1 glutamine amidotransferase